MIRMASLPVGKYENSRFLFADDGRYFEAVLPGVLDAAIRNIERMPPRNFQNMRRIGGLASSVFRRAASTHFALCEIQNTGAVPPFSHLEQSTAACLFYVIAVRGERENVEGFH